MKKLTTFIICLCFLLSACSSAPKSKAEPASTPMKAAKTFVQALTTGDEARLNTVIYHSQSMPANEIMNIAKIRKITGMKKADFTYTQDSEDEDVVTVSFLDSKGQQDKWRLVFVKNDNGNGSYQYDGFLSGTLLANSTPEIAVKTYLNALKKGSRYWLENMDHDRKPDGNTHVYQIEYFHEKLNKLKDYKIIKTKTFPDYEAVRTWIKFNLNGEKHMWAIDFYIGEDGYYYYKDELDPTERYLNIF